MSDRERRQRTGVREQVLDVGGERLMGRLQGGARGDEHEQESFGRNPAPAAPDDLTQAAARAVPLHRTPDPAPAGDEAHPAPLTGRGQNHQQAGPPAERDPIAPHAREVSGTSQAIRRQESLGVLLAHRGGGYGGGVRRAVVGIAALPAGPAGSTRMDRKDHW